MYVNSEMFPQAHGHRHGHQPRSTHSCRWGLSLPIVVSRPWPGSTSRSAGRVNSRRSIESMICSKFPPGGCRSEEHTSELQSRVDLVCRLLLEKKKPQQEAAAGALHIVER